MPKAAKPHSLVSQWMSPRKEFYYQCGCGGKFSHLDRELAKGLFKTHQQSDQDYWEILKKTLETMGYPNANNSQYALAIEHVQETMTDIEEGKHVVQ